jgi:hypothetical protein
MLKRWMLACLLIFSVSVLGSVSMASASEKKVETVETSGESKADDGLHQGAVTTFEEAQNFLREWKNPIATAGSVVFGWLLLSNVRAGRSFGTSLILALVTSLSLGTLFYCPCRGGVGVCPKKVQMLVTTAVALTATVTYGGEALMTVAGCVGTFLAAAGRRLAWRAGLTLGVVMYLMLNTLIFPYQLQTQN